MEDSEVIKIFRFMSFELDSLSSQYAAFDTIPKEERTYNKLREIVRRHMTNESIARRMDSVCNAKDPCWDGLTWMFTFDITKPKPALDEPPSTADITQQVTAVVADGGCQRLCSGAEQ